MKGLPRMALVLGGLLLLGILIITLGRSGSGTDPSASSFEPSGVRALVELLQRQNYDIVVTRDPTPRLKKEDTVVAFVAPRPFSLSAQPDTSRAVQAILDHLDGGGRALIAPLATDFREASKKALAKPQAVTSPISGARKTVHSSGYVGSAEHYELGEEGTDIWSGGPYGGFAEIYKVGDGRAIRVEDGLFMTNRFLDRDDNAVVALGLIKALAGTDGRIVFMEAAHGEISEPGLLETIGPWAEGAWWQLLLLFFVIVYTLGKRFGVPEEDRYVQTGQRELVDATAMIYQRGRATHIALRALHDYADKRLRIALKLPMDASKSARDERIPATLASSLREAEIASETRMPISIALGIARKLERELSDFLGEEPRHAKKRKKH